MKKFLTTMFAFVALAITACGGGNKAPEVKWESDKTNHWQIAEDGSTIEKAKHEFEEDKSQAVAPTCSQEGKKVEVCKVCGYVKESKVAKSDHTWGNWVDKAGDWCGPSEQEHECTVCHEKATQQCAIKQHKWVKKSEVAEGDGGVAYDVMECSECHKVSYMVAAAKATIGGSGAKTKTAPEGCIKMSPDGSYMIVSFKVEAAKTGTFFLRGSMDYWYTDSNNNQNKTYYDENNGHTDASTKTGNFKLEVGPSEDNLTNVELPDNTALKFGDMLPETVGFENIDGTNWSTIGDCIVGKASLVAGLNTIKFTRVDSYNLAVHDFVFVLDAAA